MHALSKLLELHASLSMLMELLTFMLVHMFMEHVSYYINNNNN